MSDTKNKLKFEEGGAFAVLDYDKGDPSALDQALNLVSLIHFFVFSPLCL